MASFAATISALFSKIIAFFISILIALFPNSTVELQQQRDNDLSQWAPIIEEAIRNKDTEATIEFMCNEFTQKEDNIVARIETFYNLIDGNPLDITWQVMQSSDYPGYLFASYELSFTTDTNHQYRIDVYWTTIDLEQPNRTKCTSMALFAVPPDTGDYDWLYPMIRIRSNSEQAIADDLWIQPVEQILREKNVDALKNELCVYIKNSTDSLPDRIQQFYSNIKGDIVDFDWCPALQWAVDGTIQQRYELYIWTTVDYYVIYLDYQKTNSEKPDYIGINGLYLAHPTPQGIEKLFYLASDNKAEQKYVSDWLGE